VQRQSEYLKRLLKKERLKYERLLDGFATKLLRRLRTVKVLVFASGEEKHYPLNHCGPFTGLFCERYIYQWANGLRRNLRLAVIEDEDQDDEDILSSFIVPATP